ncbi:hypothetical protein ACT3TP_05960 [Glutamicibacter sp. AOP38-B1-38]|uniref:hypothetical protein n=1 Tax=Glutamicibacter sp. AOP38-B1-38 TaxID=3457680 RepID=UPI004033213B
MEELFYTLFSQLPGTDSGMQVALFSLSALLSVVACALLAHRNDLGWWAQILAVFAGPLVIAMQYDTLFLVYAIPSLLIGVFGLWRFSRYKFQGKFTRQVLRAPLGLSAIIAAALGVAVLTALHLGEMLTTGFAFTAGTGTIWVSYLTEAVVLVSFALIACGIRAGWLLMALASAVYVATLFANNPAFALLLVWVFMVIAALYAWFMWRTLPRRDSADHAGGTPAVSG